jgi:hypothetical protein
MMLRIFHKKSSGIAVPKFFPEEFHAEAQKRGERRGRD